MLFAEGVKERVWRSYYGSISATTMQAAVEPENLCHVMNLPFIHVGILCMQTAW